MRYEFTLTGTSPLIMHYDDVLWSDTVQEWRLDSANKAKKGENKGDDRRPAWAWIGSLYHDGNNVGIPSVNLTANFKKAGARVPLDGKRTCKELAVSSIFLEQEYMTFTSNGQPVPVATILHAKKELSFQKHIEIAKKLGFSLFVKRAPIGMGKHVRVRPRFDKWGVTGTLEVTSDQITPDTLEEIFTQAGRVGLGDWRPGSPKSPGPFGMFSHKLKPIK